MADFRVLIVEDDALIAWDLEETLVAAGCDVCGVAGSQSEALRLGEATRPPFAIVDVRLAPGDGRIVARELAQLYGTAVLLATAHCGDPGDLARTGAVGCLPKPYSTPDVLAALQAVRDIRLGRPPRVLPDHMLSFAA